MMRVPHYHRQFKEKYTIDGNQHAIGNVYSYTLVNYPPVEMEDYAPYIIAIVELDDGKKLLAQLTDCEEEDIEIGTPVEMVFRKIKEKGERGLVLYGYKFRPRRS